MDRSSGQTIGGFSFGFNITYGLPNSCDQVFTFFTELHDAFKRRRYQQAVAFLKSNRFGIFGRNPTSPAQNEQDFHLFAQ